MASIRFDFPLRCLVHPPAKYGRPPFKLLLHLAIVVLTTLQVLNINQNLSPFVATGASTWNDLLVPINLRSFESVGGKNTYHICTAPMIDIKEFLFD
jgi:hypothetical protein